MAATVRAYQSQMAISDSPTSINVNVQSAKLSYPATTAVQVFGASLMVSPNAASWQFSRWASGAEVPATGTVWVGGQERPIAGLNNPTPPAPAVIFGVNVNDNNPNSAVATRIADLGRVPLCRGPYYGTLPSTYLDSRMADGRAPERRAIVSYGTPATDAQITAYAASVPANWWIGVCYYSEPNDNIKAGGLTASDWQSHLLHMSQLLASLPSSGHVVPVIIMSAPKSYADGVAWDDSWMPTFAQMNNPNAIFSWDNYDNPHGGTALATPFDTFAKVQDKAYNLLQTKGWLFEAGHWGITEFNAPERSFDATEVQRGPWLKGYIDYALARPVPPKFVCLWEGNGTQWDQNIYVQGTWDLLKPYWSNSA